MYISCTLASYIACTMALRNGVLVFANRLEGWVYILKGWVYILEDWVYILEGWVYIAKRAHVLHRRSLSVKKWKRIFSAPNNHLFRSDSSTDSRRTVYAVFEAVKRASCKGCQDKRSADQVALSCGVIGSDTSGPLVVRSAFGLSLV